MLTLNLNDRTVHRAELEAMRMPKTIGYYTNLFIKNNLNTRYDSNSATFWLAAFRDGLLTQHGYKGVYRGGMSGTSKNTIFEASGISGTLTHIVGATLGVTNGSTSIIVTVDGTEIAFNYESVAQHSRPCIGGVITGLAPQSLPGGIYESFDFGSYNDYGFYSGTPGFLLTPSQALLYGIGIRFKDSIKVEQISESSYDPSGYKDHAGVMYVPN